MNPARKLAILPIPVLIILIVYFGFVHPSARVLEPPYLFPILNTVFLFLVSCVVSYVAMRSYLSSGSSPILLLGAGVFVFGTGAFASGWTIFRWGVNVSATVHNAPLLLAAVFHVAGVIASAKEHPPETDPVRKRWKVIAAYITAPVFVYLVFRLSVEGIMPQFFVAGVGTTALRQIVLASAFVLLIYSSSYMLTRFLWKKDPYLYWYSLALALLAIMSAVFYIQPAVGSPIGWVGRGSQYIAGIYFIVAVLSARREAQARGASLDETVAELFLTPGFHWQDILKTALNGFCIVDRKGRYIEVNEACCQILGYSRKELLSMTITDVEAVESPSDVLRHVESLKEKTTDHFTSRNRRKDGVLINVEVSAKYFDVGSGQIAIFFQDITERKKAEAALRENERRLRSLFEHMLDGYAHCKMLFEHNVPQDFVYLDVNDSFKRLTGLQDVIGKKVREVIPGIRESNPELIQIYGRVATTGIPERFEMYLEPLGIWFSVSAYSPERGYFVAVFDNITERKLAEQTLRASEAKYRDLVESANSIIIRWKPDGKISFFNRFAMSFFGYREEEILGRNVMILIPEKDSSGKDLSKLAVQIVEHPQQFTNNENENILSDGRRVWVQWTNRAILDEAGNVKEILAVGNDITALKHAEQELKRNEGRFRLLSDTAGRLLATDDPQGLVNDLCQNVMKHLDCQVFFNFMADEHARRLRLNACAGISEQEIRKLEWLDYGVAVCGCVARDNVRIIAEDIFHTHDARTELIKSYGIQAYCCHPLKAQDRLIGTLSFGTKTRTHFTPDEVELMRIIADQVSIAMQRIQAEHDLRQSEKSLQLANEHLEQRVRERTMDLQNLTAELEESRDNLRKLASELVLAEEKERKRIASVLHDEIAQTLAVARMRVDMLQRLAVDDESHKTIEEAKGFLVQSIRETRALMNDIGNPLLFDMGVAAACESLADRLMAIHPIQIRCDIRDSFKDLDPEVKVILFQVIRELLNNVIKHSEARNAQVFIQMNNGQIQAMVKDDGLGFDTQTLAAPTAEGGFGLFSIRERLMAFSGHLQIESNQETGTVVTASLPARLQGMIRKQNECSE